MQTYAKANITQPLLEIINDLIYAHKLAGSGIDIDERLQAMKIFILITVKHGKIALCVGRNL
jgi:hypothetical protein